MVTQLTLQAGQAGDGVSTGASLMALPPPEEVQAVQDASREVASQIFAGLDEQPRNAEVVRKLTRTDSLERLEFFLANGEEGFASKSNLTLGNTAEPKTTPPNAMARASSFNGFLDGMLSRECSKDNLGASAEESPPAKVNPDPNP